MTGHGGLGGRPDESIIWMNAAETFVDIVEYSPPGKPPGRLVNFITEGGKLEFFMLGASNPKRIQRRLGTVTGF